MYKLLVNTETFGFFRTFLPYFFGRKGAFFVILHKFLENVRLYAPSFTACEEASNAALSTIPNPFPERKIRTST